MPTMITTSNSTAMIPIGVTPLLTMSITVKTPRPTMNTSAIVNTTMRN